jgi:hypothetical protein
MKLRTGVWSFLVAFLIVLAALPANATFPGKNGRIGVRAKNRTFSP